MTRRRPLDQLMTIRMVSEELGVPLATAKTICRHVVAQDEVVRLPGMRRTFIRRQALEFYLQSAGGMRVL